MKGDKGAWNRMSVYYDFFVRKDKSMYDSIVEDVLRRVDYDDRILEIGTATGVISLRLAEKMKSVEAIDFSEKMIERAIDKSKKLGIRNVDFKTGNAYNLQYSDASIDHIIISNVLHIMPEPEKALMEIRRVLKTDGLLFAPTIVHAGSKKTAVFAKFASFLGFKAYSKWTKKSYQQFLESNGLKVVVSKNMPTVFPFAYFICRIETDL